MNAFHSRLRRLCAVVLGLVFLASGLLKLMDPTGTQLIVKEYLKFLHLGSLGAAARGLGIGLALLESVTGAALLTGVFRKLTAIVASAMTVFFTLVTLVLLIANPEMDCGCFGEAVHLTHLQSFLKNLVLLALCLVAFLPFRNFGTPRRGRRVAFWIAVPSLLLALLDNIRELPLLDFTAYKPGAELFASLDNDYQTMDGQVPMFIYERDGQRGSFTLDRLPDSTWTFVGVDTLSRSGLARPSEKPVLSFRDAGGEYRDEDAVLGNVIVFSVPEPERADWERLRAQVSTAREAGADPLVLVAAAPSQEGLPSDPELFYADYKPLITLNRSNGGATYIHNGEIIAKWSPSVFPSGEELTETLSRDPVDASTSYVVGRRIKAQGFVLYLLALLFLL